MSSEEGGLALHRAPYVLMAASMANLGGTGVYTRRLLKGFCSTAKGRVAAAVGSSLVSPEEALSMDPQGSTFQKLVQENFSLPGAVRRNRPSMVHLPAFGGSVTGDIPYAVTVHDLAFLRNPGWFPPLRSLYYSMRFRRVAKRATLVMADSDFTASEIEQLLKINSARIRRVYLSTDAFKEDPDIWRNDSGIKGEYIIYAGTVEPRKNLQALLSAWTRVKSEHRDLQLVIAGRWGWGPESLRKSLHSSPGVHFTGRLSFRMLRSCISGARLMVYPSLYEGFGLPPLEAASAGVPAVLAPADALMEIYGDVARFSAGFDRHSIAEAILEGLDTPADADALMNFASAFTPEIMAGEVLELYGEFAE